MFYMSKMLMNNKKKNNPEIILKTINQILVNMKVKI